MANLQLQHGERKWQRYVLVPLNLAILAGIVAALLNNRWIGAGAFVFLLLYVGAIGARLSFHRSKGFAELSQGITPDLPDQKVPGMWQDMPETDRHAFISTVVHTLYVVVLVALIVGFESGLKWYWVLAIAVAVLIVARVVLLFFAALVMRATEPAVR